jgi:putative pyruvate formate lyase activating enzyme
LKFETDAEIGQKVPFCKGLEKRFKTMSALKPAYIETFKNGLLRKKIETADKILSFCKLCPRECGVDRLTGETGLCNTGEKAFVSSYNPHFGEEAPLVGTGGSGTIFFTHCNLLCLFCQNYDISHEGFGEEVTSEQLAEIMLHLQDIGCHNINFVTPSHVVPQILSAVSFAAENGLNVPLVYNTGGYDSVETLKLLEGVFDIYMPDFKFWSPEIAEAACKAKDYPEIARNALIEMHKQVGDLVLDEYGIAMRGLLIRHLVLPDGLAGTREIMKFIAKDISSNSYVNIMAQYRPCGRAAEIEGLSARLKPVDFETAYQAAIEEGITRLDKPKRVFVIN